MISIEIDVQMVSCIKYKGNVIIGYEHRPQPYQNCFTYSTVDEVIVLGSPSSPLERLRIADDCTAFRVLYIARDPLPARAVSGGRMVSGEVAYVVMLDILEDSSTIWISGYYTEGALYAVSAYYSLQISTTMMMLVVLWRYLHTYIIWCEKMINTIISKQQTAVMAISPYIKSPGPWSSRKWIISFRPKVCLSALWNGRSNGKLHTI